MKITLKNKRVIVLGLGETGLSALRWLRNQDTDLRLAELSVADTREGLASADVVKHDMPEVVINIGALDATLLSAMDLIVASPGIPLSEPAIQQAIASGVQVVGDVELFAQHRPAQAKVIAITGANGKTTVTTLVGEMCEAAGLKVVVAGNIGLPVLDTLSMPTADVYVLELSSFQLEATSSLAIDAAAMLNLTEDHMDRYADLTAYAQAKARIFYNATSQVLNRDDAWSMVMERSSLSLSTFGLAQDETHFGIEALGEESWLCEGKQRLLKLEEMQIKGMHNAGNALAALALCRAIGLSNAPLLNALRNFKGLPHRVSWVANIEDVDYYNDSKATNVAATCAALAGLATKVVLIAGGEGKDQDFKALQAPVKNYARAVVLIGQDAALIEAALLATDVPMYHGQDMTEAVVIAQKLADTGDAVLLSPACASFDMFNNYIHRAEAFITAVERLEVATC